MNYQQTTKTRQTQLNQPQKHNYATPSIKTKHPNHNQNSK